MQIIHFRICDVNNQAWNFTEATEAMASVAPGLGLGALSKIPIDFTIFQWKRPFENENGLALSKMKFQA